MKPFEEIYEEPIEVQAASQCNLCKHQDIDNPLRCRAFPGGIPSEILFNEAWHTKAYKGQGNEIKFEPK